MQNKLLFFYKKTSNLIVNFYEYIINILFPPVCVLCGSFNKNWLCEKCHKKIKKLIRNEIIYNNINSVKIFKRKKYVKLKYKNIRIRRIKNKVFNTKKNNKILYIFEYKGIIRKLIIDYKFNDKSYLNNFFSNIILNSKFNCDILKKYDIIISVPLSKNRKATRGYNQTDLIAKNISKKLKIYYKSDYLIKIKETKKQSSLNKFERKKNIQNAYIFNKKYNIENKNVILIDDVFTTGSTVNECLRVLKENGAKEILILIIAKD